MDFHQLKIFAAVYRTKSFTKASERMHISQPTISEHIKNLENEFSCRLFDRLGRAIAPTPRADSLYPKVLRLLDDLERLSDDFLTDDGPIKGELIVGASTIPGTYILPWQAGKFRSEHPGISFEIRINDTLQVSEMVLNHQIYMGVIGAKADNKLLSYIPIVADELVFVADQSLISRRLPDLQLLAELPLIVREHGSGTRDNMMRLLGEAGLEVDRLQVAAVLGSSASVKEAVKAGLGGSCLSRLAVSDELARGTLVEIPLNGLILKRYFYLIHHKNRTLPKHYKVFADYLSILNIS